MLKQTVNGLLHGEEIRNKLFEAFLQNNAVGNLCKARLITGKEKKKKFLKPLLVIKVCQAISLVVNKTVKFTETFKYATTLVPLAAGTKKSTLYQSNKVGLRPYIISLPKISSHEYPRDVKRVVDGLAEVCSVPARTTYKEWFKTLLTFIALPAKPWVKSLESLWRHT